LSGIVKRANQGESAQVIVVALTGAALFEKRADMVAIEGLRQVIMEPGHSRLADIGGIRVT
jgi:hypothetical protein